MMPKMRCSQRSAIISLACGVSRNEKCGCHSGKENMKRCRNTATPRNWGELSSRTTVTDCGGDRQSCNPTMVELREFVSRGESHYSYENTFRRSELEAPRSFCGPGVPAA